MKVICDDSISTFSIITTFNGNFCPLKSLELALSIFVMTLRMDAAGMIVMVVIRLW